MIQIDEETKKEKQKKVTPEYMILYPRFETITEKIELTSQKNINNGLNEEEDEKYEINEEFLEIILKKPILYGKNKIVNTLSKNIQSSNLSKKLLAEYRSEKKINEVNICNSFVENLNFSKLQANEILYRIGENDNRLFYILSGRIQVLKLKEIPFEKMTNLDYLNYCKYLSMNNEFYILNEVINSNNKILPFISQKDVISIAKTHFMSELLEKLQKHMITRNIELVRFFHLYDYSYDDFNINTTEINVIEHKKYKKIPGAEQEWENYIIERCSPTESEFHYYERFKILLKSKQLRLINCYVYECDSYLEPGNFFGDLSYDSHFIENKFTIRAQEDTVLAWIKNNDYLNVIDPKRKMENLRIISYLHNFFFFKEISNNSFEKNFYGYFSPREFSRNSIVYTSGDKPMELLFLREGKLSLDIKCTIIDLFFLIKDLFNALLSNEILNNLSKNKRKMLLTKETINILKKCAYDDRLKKTIRQNPILFEELKKPKTFHLSEINGCDIIGIEEVFLNIPYIMKCSVNDKKVVCYGFPTKNIPRIIKEGHELLNSFIQTSINKIISLIKRLDTIKTNSLNFAKMKFDYDLKINENEANEIKSNNDSLKNNNLFLSNNNKSLYENYKNNQLILITENSEIKNNTYNENNINSFDNSDVGLNTYNSFFGTKCPVKKSMLTNNLKKVISLHRKFSKTNDFSKSNSKTFASNERGSITSNTQNLFRTDNTKKNKNSFFFKNDDDENKNDKNENNTNKDFDRKKSLFDKNNKKENIMMIGKNQINIDNIRKNIDGFLSCDNSGKYVEIIQSNKVNNNSMSNFYNHNIAKQSNYVEKTSLFHKRNFHLSLVPLNNLNIFTNNNLCSDEKNTTNIFYETNKTKGSITDFIGVSSSDYYIPTFPNQINTSKSLLPKIKLKFDLFKNRNYNSSKGKIKKEQNKEKYNIKKKIKKEVGKDIIKEYYNDIKMNGCLSFIPNKQINTIFMRKFNQKYKDAIRTKKYNC